MKRKRAAEGNLTPEEQQRRQLQRSLQKLAIKVRSEGGTYKPQKHKRKAVKAHLQESGQLPPKKQKKEKKSKHDTPSWRPYDNPDVVIIPIYWNMHHEEKDTVFKAAERVRGLLEEAGIRSQVDAANQYTPGQKMKYWETAGVKLRVELGPKEAQAGTAVIARAGEPGTVAQKTTVNVTVQLVKELKVALQEVTDANPEANGASEDPEPSSDEGPAPVNEDTHMEDAAARHPPTTRSKQAQAKSHAAAAGNTRDDSSSDDDMGVQQGDSDGGVRQDEEGSEGGSDDGLAGTTAGGGGGAGVGPGHGRGKGEEAAGGRSGKVLTNREKKQLKREKKRAAQEEAKRELSGVNVQEGSRRDKKRRAKAALIARAASEMAAGFADDETEPRDAPAAAGDADAAEPAPAAKGKAARKHKKSGQASDADALNGASTPAEPVTKEKHKRNSAHTQAAQSDPAPAEQPPAAASAHHLLADDDGHADQHVESHANGSAGPHAAAHTAPTKHRAPSSKAAVVDSAGGDDMGDDFEIDPAFMGEAEEVVLTMSKDQRIKRVKKLEKERKRKAKFSGDVRAWDAQPGDAAAPAAGPNQAAQVTKAKKSKLVVF